MSKGDPREPRDLSHLSFREESVGDPALVEDLDGACMQTARARAGEVLAGPSLDDDDVHPRQRQLARQHQPGRTASGDHHRMLGHRHVVTPIRSGIQAPEPAIMGHDQRLAASPPVGPIMEVEAGPPSVLACTPGRRGRVVEDVPIQFFQSVVAIELAVTGALLFQVRYFSPREGTAREDVRLPSATLAWPLRSFSERPLFGSLLAMLPAVTGPPRPPS
jgi:hypothetical protein